MMPADAPEVEVYAGDTTSFHSYTFLEADEPLNLVAAGWGSWSAQWRKQAAANDPVALAIDTTRAAEGIIAVSCSSTQSRAMGGDGVWDLQASRSGETRTFVRGRTVWTKDVSRA